MAYTLEQLENKLLDNHLDREEEGENNNPKPVYRHPLTGRYTTRRAILSFNLSNWVKK